MTTITADQREAVAILAYVYLQNNRLEQADALLAALHALGDANPKVLPSLAWVRLHLGKPEAALEILDRLAVQGDTSVAFHLLRAEALTHLNRMDDARLAMLAYVQARTRLGVALPEK